jgi:SAM-dependent methyltransferase
MCEAGGIGEMFLPRAFCLLACPDRLRSMLRGLLDGARRLRRWIHATYIDLRLFVTGKTDPELPPMRLRFVGAGDFRAVGNEMAGLLISPGGLKPSDRVLDVGCGIGRIALPLTRFLDASATYDGFDIVRRGVEWCTKNITPRHPNFGFRLVEVRNPEYRRQGAAASSFRFPFGDAAFDFALATSLYTHLNPDEMQQYLRESRRVLSKGGTLFATFYLLNEPARANLASRAPYDFPIVDGVVRRMSTGSSTSGVAYEEAFVVSVLESAGFHEIRIEHGQWSGREGLTWQDIIIAR